MGWKALFSGIKCCVFQPTDLGVVGDRRLRILGHQLVPHEMSVARLRVRHGSLRIGERGMILRLDRDPQPGTVLAPGSAPARP